MKHFILYDQPVALVYGAGDIKKDFTGEQLQMKYSSSV